MKTLMLTIAALMIATLAVTAGPVNAATSNGPYYATPAWDQQLQCDTSATCPRFIVLSNWGNAAVLDRETGLVWEQSPDTTARPWGGPGVLFPTSAQFHCMALTVGNRKGWRLPTIQELASLVDPTQSNPALPAGHPFSNVQSSFYWSATTTATFASNAWGVLFGVGGVFTSVKTGTQFVWCVRGGHGVDPQ